MSSKICTCKWGINVLYNSVYTHSTRVILRELCETKRGGVISGGNNTNSNDGDSLYGSIGPKWTISKTMKYVKKYDNLHTVETQLAVRDDNRQKAGVYLIVNNVNGKRYVGSASTNRINTRFRNHFIHGHGAKNTNAAIAKYGIENFTFYILEYYPGIVKKENLSSSHMALMEMETKYITELQPEYNILQIGGSSQGYKHTEETRQRMRENYSQERKDKARAARLGEKHSAERRQMMSEISKLRNANEELRARLSAKASKPVTLYNEDGSVHSKYSGIRVMAKE